MKAHDRRPSFFVKAAVAFSLVVGVVACSAGDDLLDDEEELAEEDDGSEDSHEETSEALRTAGVCAGSALDRAVKCAQRKGARVLSYYRSPADQERVRRQNRCTNRCVGGAGCIRPTAGCTTSPHTRCKAVDLFNDGYPVSRAQLRACGLGKTTAPHRNHYDLLF